MSQLKLNLDAKSYVPINLRNSDAAPYKKTPLNINAKTFQPTSLKKESQPFIPKGFHASLGQSQTPLSIQKPPVKKEKKIDREYFVIDEDDKQIYNFDYDYMISFENWEICKETKLLSEDFLKHLEQFKIVESEPIKMNNQGKSGGKKRHNAYNNKNQSNEKKNETDLSTFGRKDISKEIALAEEFKKKIDEEANKDPVRFKITEHLNILTVDNYKLTSDNIYEIIKDDIENQEKFLDVLFNKSVNEKAYVKLYAKLCKDFDKKLPQKAPKKDEKSTKKPTSMMRVKLLDKCRQIFKIENNEKFDEYIKVADPVEREIKLKKFVLGNVNFIGELINIQILSKKIVSQCLNNLLARFNDEKADKSLKMINLEAIVILLDNFGTLLKLKEDKMKEEDKKTFNSLVHEYLKKLEDVIEKEQNLVQYVKYKIINLIERSKNNWEKSKFDKSLEAKGKKDLEDEDENEKNDREKSTLKPYSQDEITEAMSKDLINFKDYIVEDEGTPSQYDWATIESIYRDHGNSVAEMIQGFLYSCLDFVQNDKTLKLAKDYFTELIFYYKKTISNKEKKDIVNKTLHLIRVARDFSLDNPQIIDVWCVMLSNLIRAHLVAREDLIELNDMDKEDLKTVFIIIAKIIKDDPDAKIHYDKCKFVQQNKALYAEAMKEINK